MILKWIIFISLGQAVLYLISDKFDFKYGTILIFLTVLVSHFFFLPKYFYPEPESDGVGCGMPILGITLAFWGLGGGLTCITYLLYVINQNKF